MRSLFLEQLAHQPERRLRIAPRLNENVEDLVRDRRRATSTFASRRSGQPFSSTCHRALGHGRPCRSLHAISGPNFSTQRRTVFIGDVEPTLGRQFLDVSVAQREAEIQPDRVLDDLRREALTAVGERSDLDILPGTLLSRPRSHDNVCASQAVFCHRLLRGPRESLIIAYYD